jgi:hypothetical protein
MSQITKHTIEVEVEVLWDEGRPYFMQLAKFYWTDSELEALGITRPSPPYVPQVGDIVTYTGRVNFYQVSGHHDDGDVELMCANKSIHLFKIPPDKLTFIARP